MLMLRLQRIGRRNEAHFKMVVIEKSKGPKSQKYVDIVGSYNPKLGRIQLDEEKIKTHLANGVQPSDTVYNMLVEKGIIEGRKINVLPQKSPVVDEEAIARAKEEAEAKAAAEAEAAAEGDEAAETVEETPAEEPTEEAEAPTESTEEEKTEE